MKIKLLMNSTFKMIAVVFILLNLISLLFYLINKNEKWDKETSNIFECGFNSFTLNRHSFSSQYFLVAILFIFLDLEFCLMMPYLFIMPLNMKTFVFLSMLLSMVLTGILMEWKAKSLDWKL